MSCGMDEIYERAIELYWEDENREPTDKEIEEMFLIYCDSIRGCYEY